MKKAYAKVPEDEVGGASAAVPKCLRKVVWLRPTRAVGRRFHHLQMKKIREGGAAGASLLESSSRQQLFCLISFVTGI